MLLSLSTTRNPATDLGFILHKKPDRPQSFPLRFGQGHVFYPDATADRCTAVLFVEVDPVAITRGKHEDPQGGYISDRPYAASSYLSVAISQVYGSALAGTSRERPELVDLVLPIEASIVPLPCRGGEALLRRLFEPLGYAVTAQNLPLDAGDPHRGYSPYFDVTLTGELTVRDVLRHLYVLVPVLDDEKHYWVAESEIDKLLKQGDGWLAAHPARELIATRYLKHQGGLVREAVTRLTRDEIAELDASTDHQAAEETTIEQPIKLGEARIAAVMAALKGQNIRKVLDLGCGEGRLAEALLKDSDFTRILGIDASPVSLQRAAARVRLDRLVPRQRQRIDFIQGALTYRDRRLSGFDAAVAMEVIEHIEPTSLTLFERSVFEFANPHVVIVTTPNIEYNKRFESLPAGRLRHRDHRFEWTRAEFEGWATTICERFGYAVRFEGIGPEDREAGMPTQMAVFSR
ncbi:MAG: 3' terminal RNA ribose 2'-O-methyltransferase Hen1 [Chloroflexota bacterium]